MSLLLVFQSFFNLPRSSFLFPRLLLMATVHYSLCYATCIKLKCKTSVTSCWHYLYYSTCIEWKKKASSASFGLYTMMPSCVIGNQIDHKSLGVYTSSIYFIVFYLFCGFCPSLLVLSSVLYSLILHNWLFISSMEATSWNDHKAL